ncbi:MAG TPA: hypothetical protein VNO50_02990 [Pyrinomonadaceae bacterium]|nr:hypothetical protein [Pyrinomonadaceae bacterium]
MRGAKHGIRGLGLVVLAVIGVMAFTAVGAQAQVSHELHLAGLTNPNPLASPATNSPGEFLVNLGSALLATFIGEQLGKGYLLVQARDLKIECTGFDLTNGKINSSTDASAEAIFLGCVLLTHAGLPLEGCEFKELGIIKSSYLVLPILHGGVNYLLFEPLTGTNFTVISFKAGQGCILPLNNPKTGSIVAKVGALDAVVQTITFGEAIQLLVGDVVKYGALNNTAYLTGTVHISLLGSHFGQKLGIH